MLGGRPARQFWYTLSAVSKVILIMYNCILLSSLAISGLYRQSVQKKNTFSNVLSSHCMCESKGTPLLQWNNQCSPCSLEATGGIVLKRTNGCLVSRGSQRERLRRCRECTLGALHPSGKSSMVRKGCCALGLEDSDLCTLGALFQSVQ